MNYPIVLGVCSANVQRSPTYEAVMKYTLRKQEPAQIIIESAGINVQNIIDNKVSLETMVNSLEAGLHYGLVRADKKEEVEALVESYHTSTELGEQDKIRSILFRS